MFSSVVFEASVDRITNDGEDGYNIAVDFLRYHNSGGVSLGSFVVHGAASDIERCKFGEGQRCTFVGELDIVGGQIRIEVSHVRQHRGPQDA